MESSSWLESVPSNRIKAIQELAKGQTITDKLREMLGQQEKIESDYKSDDVVVEILGVFNNTLSVLHSSKLNRIPHDPTKDLRSLSGFDESMKTLTPVKTKRGCYNRRKNVSTNTKITSNLIDDGYAWRKYGQKVILNSKHQRNYYRCSHKFEQGCQATKQVQKTDDNPSKYKTTYSGLHTCNNSQRTPQIIVEAPDPIDNSILISFETNTFMENNKVNTCFVSIQHPVHNEGLPSLGRVKHEEVSKYDDHTLWDPVMELSQVPLEPLSMMSCALDGEDTVYSGVFSSTCSTNGYKIEDIIESHDYGDFLFELW